MTFELTPFSPFPTSLLSAPHPLSQPSHPSFIQIMSSPSAPDPDYRNNYPDYDASSAAALVFVVLFGLSAITHVVQATLRRSWWMWPLIVGVFGTSRRNADSSRGGGGSKRRGRWG